MIVDVVRLASKNRMTLTKAIRKKMKLDVGDILAFIEDEEKILEHSSFN